VVFTVDGADERAHEQVPCLAVGGILRLTNVGPQITEDPPSQATCVWEAGIANCRLLNAGTVKITYGDPARTITVVVK
jgi:hypothetical protein